MLTRASAKIIVTDVTTFPCQITDMMYTLFANLIDMALKGETTSIKHNSRIENLETGESLFPSISIGNKADSNLRCSTEPNNMSSIFDGLNKSLSKQRLGG